jgi:Tfp pilus assembly protein PilF
LATKTLAIIIFAALLLAACVTPEPVLKTDQYHAREPVQKTTKALNGLQLKAIKLMNQQQYQQSQLYLQRAIKVEPRNPLNWHYMAQNYWFMKDFEQCRAMIKRAEAYSQFDADLQKANRILLRQCNAE